MPNQDQPDYKNNPTYSDEYTKFQGDSASPALQYRWDSQSGIWTPDTNEDKLDTILRVFSGQLSGIHVEAKLDHDTVAHEYLSSISGDLTGIHHQNWLTSSTLLEFGNSNLGFLENIDDTLDETLTTTRGLFENISGTLSGMHAMDQARNIINTEGFDLLDQHLDENNDKLQALNNQQEKANKYHESISGTLTGSLFEQEETNEKLEQLNTTASNQSLKLSDIKDQTLLSAQLETQLLDEAKQSNVQLSGISGELSDIEVHVSTDADTKSHGLLENISGTLTGSLKEEKQINQNLTQLQGKAQDIDTSVGWVLDESRHITDASRESNTWLSGISGELADIEVHVSTDADTKSHGLLESISGQVVHWKQQEETNTWLSGISGELSDIEVHVSTDADTESHGLLRSASGTLTGSLAEQKETNVWLKGISGELADIEVHVSTDADTESHGLLRSASGALTGSLAEQKETNVWLKGISGELADIEVHVSTDADTKSHGLLESISGTLTGQQSETNSWLKGISGELADIEVHVSTDADTKSHGLLESISGTLTGQQSETNSWLKGISGELADIEVGVTVDSDETAHAFLQTISEDALRSRINLDTILPVLTGKLITSDAKSQQALLNISGLVDIGNTLSRLNFTKRTDTFTEKIEADHIILEAPDSEFYGNNPGPQYGVDRDILDDLFNTQYKNGRDNPNTPEAGQFFMLDEKAPDNRPKQRKYSFDTEAQYALKLDSFKGNLEGAQRLSDQGLGNIQNVTILNDSIYPFKIYCSETNYKSFHLYDGHSASIDNTNASDIMVKRDHTISGFNVDYTITYLDPNAEVNLERIVGAFSPPEPPPEIRWPTWVPQAPASPEAEVPVATENPEVEEKQNPILGCTNPDSLNYNPLATEDDGSCIEKIFGCTDPTATNYNQYANADDGSCTFPPPAPEAYSNTYSVSFNGTDGYLDAGNIAALNSSTAFSISLWFKTSSTESVQLFEGSDFGANAYKHSVSAYLTDHAFDFLIGKGGTYAGIRVLTTSKDFRDGNWHHFCGTFGDSTPTMYIDGVSVGFGIPTPGFVFPSTTQATAGNNFHIGVSQSPHNWFDGSMDEFAIWDTTLSAEDVHKIYTAGTPTDLTLASAYSTDRTSNLKNYWRMSD